MGGIGRAVVAVPGSMHTAGPVLSLLAQKRLLFFVGKGGVGKTTVATAVALAFAHLGKKTLLIEFDENTRAARLLGLPTQPVTAKDPHPYSASLFVLSTNGQIALEEYLRLIIPVRPVLRAIVESRAYQYFVAAAPGLKELLTMGKVWYEERKREPGSSHLLWDILIVDLPATGHSLQYLQMPRAAHETFGGVVGREAERIWALLNNAEKTAVNLVTCPDELAVSETHDAYQRIVKNLKLPIGALFINRLHSAPLSAQTLKETRPGAHMPATKRALCEHILRCAAHEVAVVEAQQWFQPALSQLPVPAVPIPFCFVEDLQSAIVERLACDLAAAMTQEEPAESQEHHRFINRSAYGR